MIPCVYTYIYIYMYMYIYIYVYIYIYIYTYIYIYMYRYIDTTITKHGQTSYWLVAVPRDATSSDLLTDLPSDWSKAFNLHGSGGLALAGEGLAWDGDRWDLESDLVHGFQATQWNCSGYLVVTEWNVVNLRSDTGFFSCYFMVILMDLPYQNKTFQWIF